MWNQNYTETAANCFTFEKEKQKIIKRKSCRKQIINEISGEYDDGQD